MFHNSSSYLHPQQLHQNGKSFLLSHSRTNFDTGLPIAGREVLKRARRRLEGLRIRARLQQLQIGLDHLGLPEKLHASDRLGSRAGRGAGCGRLLLHRLPVLLLLAAPEATEVLA